MSTIKQLKNLVNYNTDGIGITCQLDTTTLKMKRALLIMLFSTNGEKKPKQL